MQLPAMPIRKARQVQGAAPSCICSYAFTQRSTDAVQCTCYATPLIVLGSRCTDQASCLRLRLYSAEQRDRHIQPATNACASQCACKPEHHYPPSCCFNCWAGRPPFHFSCCQPVPPCPVAAAAAATAAAAMAAAAAPAPVAAAAFLPLSSCRQALPDEQQCCCQMPTCRSLSLAAPESLAAVPALQA